MPELFDDCEFQKNVPEGQHYAAGSQPIIFDDEGKVLRSFKETEKGFVEQPLEDEVIEKVDLAEYIKRHGGPNPRRLYDILELGYWCKDGSYTEPDELFVLHVESVGNGEGGIL